MRTLSRAAGLLLGYAADRWLGDPRRLHPVAGFGAVAAKAESVTYADRRANGAVHCGLLVGGVVALGVAGEMLSRRRPLAHTVLTAVATWAVLGGRSLEREATAVGDLLVRGDLPAARVRLRHLVGRDTTRLTEEEMARAVVESVAENTSDAVVAALLWGAVAGAPGLLGYRAANTLDAMVGHRTPRYRTFGWGAARLDDMLNLPGARLAGLLTAAAEPRQARRVLLTWCHDAAGHPSPNAGVVEAAFAGALGVRLGGTNTYGTWVEHRAVLGDGRAPVPEDIGPATRLARKVGLGAALLAAITSGLEGAAD